MGLSDPIQVVWIFWQSPLPANPKPWPQPCGFIFQLFIIIGTWKAAAGEGGRSQRIIYGVTYLYLYLHSRGQTQIANLGQQAL